MAPFYELHGSEAPWSDYGNILRNGMLATRRGGDDQAVEVERTGPFIPPITFPFDAIVVTEATKERLEAVSFIGLRFSRASYAKVVKLDWQEWDALAPDPQRYPAAGEPENYIIKRKHCGRTAALMPPIWTFDVQPTPGLQLMGSSRFKRDQAPDADIFREYSIHWVSERMRVWLERNLGEWVRCTPVKPA